MPGKHSRNKGAAYEREIVNYLKDNGIEAERVPLSGAMKGNYGGDIKLGPVLRYIGECKRRTTLISYLPEMT
jgi:Holliday junction resolvase